MVPCTFTRLVAKLDGPKVSFNRSEEVETILVESHFERKTIVPQVILDGVHQNK